MVPPPQWSDRALLAVASLFRSLQDIDVYVEDEGSEDFYLELLTRVKPKELRIARVLPLNGRANVIERAKSHDFSRRRALFLIDGDFEWVRGEAGAPCRGLYRLDAYCVENLLVCPDAATELLRECQACSAEKAAEALRFQDWLKQLDVLVRLFIAWAVINELEPETATVGQGIGKFLDGRTNPPRLSRRKVEKEAERVEKRVEKIEGGEQLLAATRERVDALARPRDVVSGKDFLLPCLDFHLRAKSKEKVRRTVLKFRLARHVNVGRFTDLAEALQRAAKGVHEHPWSI